MFGVRVNEAVELITSYNGRLQQEMENRKLLTKMLHDFTASQKELLVQAETRLQVVKAIWNPFIYIHEFNIIIIQQVPKTYIYVRFS